MGNKDILYEPNDYLIIRLKYYLNYELSTSVLLILWYVPFMGLILALAAVIFTPYLSYVLYKTKKYGWLIIFNVLVTIPVIILSFINLSSDLDKVLLMIELGMFFFLCAILRYVVIDWCEEINWKIIRREQKLKKEETDILFQKYIDE